MSQSKCKRMNDVADVADFPIATQQVRRSKVERQRANTTRVTTLVIILGFAVGCTSAPKTPPGPEKTTVDVTVSGSQKEAFDLVRSAFVGEGLTIAEANAEGGVVTSQPVAASSPGALMPVQITYRANIVPAAAGDLGSRVVLSAEAKIVGGPEARSGMFTVRTEGRSGMVRESCLTQQPNGPCAQAWERLTRIGATIGVRR